MTRRNALRFGVPALVSLALLAWIFRTIPLRQAVETVTPSAALGSLAVVVAFIAVTLALEALSFARASVGAGAEASLGDWARVKAASYPPQMAHHTLGLAALTYLIQRRLGFPVLVVVGIVALVPLFDILSMLLVISVAAASTTMASGVQVPVVAAIAAALVLGLVWLRSDVPLGPLDRIRALPPLVAARAAPLRTLLELGGLRLAFVASFILLWGGALAAFGIDVPPAQLAIGISLTAAASALPSVSGFGTSQAAFLAVFEGAATPEALLGCNLFVSVLLIALRVAMGLLFAGEFTRDAFLAAQQEATHASVEATNGAGS